MICFNCYSPCEGEANFCKDCGADLISLEPRNPPRWNDTVLLSIYISWHFMALIYYGLLTKVISRSGIETSEIIIYLKISDFVYFGLDLAFLIFLTARLKNKTARIFCLIFLVSRLGLMLFLRMY